MRGWRPCLPLGLALAGMAATLVMSEPAIAQSCPAMRWTTLGTAGGPVPTVDRSEPANLLDAGGQKVLVDTGDGTVTQLARLGLMLGPIRSVFISHHHADHTGGLAAVIALRWMNQFPGVLTVYGPPGTRELVDGIVASLAPQGRIGFGVGVVPPPPSGSVRVVELDGGAHVDLDGLAVTTTANSHFVHPGPASEHEPVSLSYRFQLGARSITYTGDTGPSAAVAQLAKGTQMLVSEVIDLDRLVADMRRLRPDATPEMLDQMRRHLSTHHISAVDLGKLAAAAGAERLVLTHFAIPGPLSESEPDLRKGIGATYSGPVSLSRDLASFDIPC